MATTPQKAIIYARVSTQEQAEEGVSLDAQVAKARAYAELYDIQIVDVIRDEGESGKNLDRPGIERVLAALATGEADTLIVYKLDRLTRSVTDMGRLVERTFQTSTLLSVQEHVDTSTAAGRMLLNILVTMAQWVREDIVERTSAALAHKRAQGQRVGQIPYGMKLGADGKTLEPHEDEQEIVSRILLWRRCGLSLRKIVTKLNEEQVPARSRNGSTEPGRWHYPVVQRIVKRAEAA